MRSKSMCTACARSWSRAEYGFRPCAASATAWKSRMPAERDSRFRWRTVFDTLLAEILLWLLILFLMVWSIGVVMIYNVTGKFANEPYDVVLSNNAQALANQIGYSTGRITINLPRAAREILVTDPQDKVYIQISDLSGVLLVGDAEVPWVSTAEHFALDKVFL